MFPYITALFFCYTATHLPPSHPYFRSTTPISLPAVCRFPESWSLISRAEWQLVSLSFKLELFTSFQEEEEEKKEDFWGGEPYLGSPGRFHSGALAWWPWAAHRGGAGASGPCWSSLHRQPSDVALTAWWSDSSPEPQRGSGSPSCGGNQCTARACPRLTVRAVQASDFSCIWVWKAKGFETEREEEWAPPPLCLQTVSLSCSLVYNSINSLSTGGSPQVCALCSPRGSLCSSCSIFPKGWGIFLKACLPEAKRTVWREQREETEKANNWKQLSSQTVVFHHILNCKFKTQHGSEETLSCISSSTQRIGMHWTDPGSLSALPRHFT